MTVKKFDIQAKTVIESANLELDAIQLQLLADAAPHLQEVVEQYEITASDNGREKDGRTEVAHALDPVMSLLTSVASLVDQTGVIQPKRKIARRKPAKRNPTAGKSPDAAKPPPAPDRNAQSTPIVGAAAASTSG